MSILQTTLDALSPVDRSMEPTIQAHLDDLTKPRCSLGKLETIAMQYCLARQTTNPRIERKEILCFAGDHGVAAEGVSAYPQEVTPQMVMNMLSGGAAINVLAKHVNATLTVVDMGVNDPLEFAEGLVRCKVANGTQNIAEGPAMTTQQAIQALESGIQLAEKAAAKGVDLLGTGEMGIANTTPATALCSAYLDIPVELITGRGTGLDEKGVKNKVAVLNRVMRVNSQRLTSPLDTLAALGGFEIAGIAGLAIGAAAASIPVVVDGFISTAAALAACKLSPPVSDYLFFSHLSEEQGHKSILEKMDVHPILSLDMRLGEGTGAALAMSVIEAAIRVYNGMATFSSAGVSDKDN